MFGEECGCLMCVFLLLMVVFVGLALLHYPTRKRQKELEYMLREELGAWRKERQEQQGKKWDESLPQ